jgi:hypothetical protein
MAKLSFVFPWSFDTSSVPDTGSLPRIRIFPFRIHGPNGTGSGSPTKNVKMFYPKNKALGRMIRDVYSGSQIWIFTFPDPGIKKAPDPRSGSATLDTSVLYCYYCTYLRVHAPPAPCSVVFFALSPVFPFLSCDI